MKRLNLIVVILVLISCLVFGFSIREGYSADAKGKLTADNILPEGVSKYGDTIYMSIRYIDFNNIRDVFLSLKSISYKVVVIDLLTSGGSLFDAMGIISIFKEQQSTGKIIEIRGRGLIASAGLLILISGNPGYRYLDEWSMIMFHEFWQFKFFAIETPADKEEEAKIMRKIQDKVNDYIIMHSKITKQELNEKIKKKELWLDADEAVKYGFADTVKRFGTFTKIEKEK